MTTSPPKSVRIGGKMFSIVGAEGSDPYFDSLADGINDDFNTFCSQYVRSNHVALDIGANIGITSCILSQHIQQGQIHSFEPGGRVYAALNKNISANGLARVTTHNAALGDSVGDARFDENSAYGHLTNDPDAQAVDLSTIDSFVQFLGLQRVDFIKIDVEGNEFAVLRGAMQTIKKFNPLIFMEFNSWCLCAYGDTNPVEFARWIVRNFPYAHRMTPAGLVEINRQHPHLLAHDNMVLHGSLDDLVLTTDQSRLAKQEIIETSKLRGRLLAQFRGR